MLMHVVTFKWHQGTAHHMIEGLGAALSRLPGIIPDLIAYRHGPDLGVRGTADYAVVALVEDADALGRYLDHPEHLELVAEFTGRMTAERTAVQFGVSSAAEGMFTATRPEPAT